MPCSVSSCPDWSNRLAGCQSSGASREPGSLPSGQRVCSLVAASLEIGKALADSDRVTFRAQGTCMYPCVRPGDVLRIESRAAEEVAIGDIAVCRRPGYLFGHRTIDKGVEDGRRYIVTRPDRSSSGSDGPTYGEDVLGIVTAIERKGKRVEPRRRRYPWPVRLYLDRS